MQRSKDSIDAVAVENPEFQTVGNDLGRSFPEHVSSLDIGNLVEKQGAFYAKVGEFSDVWKGIYTQKGEDNKKDIRNLKVAIKVIRGAPAYNHELHDKVKKDLVSAGSRWINLKHPNILPFHGIVYDYSFLPAMVCTYCDAGNVLEYIQESKPSEQRKLDLVYDVIKGLAHLHSVDIIHGDLRAANVLVDEHGNAVLADYGLTFIIDSSEFTTTKIAGPARWTAPEILDSPDDEEVSEAHYSTKSDVFAFAMTFIEIITGQPPFQRIKNDSAVIFKILGEKRPEIPDVIKERADVVDILGRCWAHEPSERPEASDVQRALKSAFASSDTRSSVLGHYQYSFGNTTSVVGDGD